MKRLMWIAVMGAAVVAAAALPEPAPPVPPSRRIVVPTDDAAPSGVWYCSWLESSFEREGILAVATQGASTAAFTFPNPEPGQEADAMSLEIPAPGAAALTMSEVAFRGSVPGIVEFSGGPAGAAVIVSSDRSVAADSCIASQPRVWYLVGGSTLQDESLTLRLFNPFPEAAKVNVTASSEFGAEPLPGESSLSIAPRSWVDLSIDEDLRLRETISVTVAAQSGIVLPVFVLSTPDDEAVWSGTGLSTRWEFPVVRSGASQPVLAVTNPGPTPATVTIDVFTPEGATPLARSEVVPGGTPVTIPLGDLADGALGVRVKSDAPVAAAVVTKGGGGVAATTGVVRGAGGWLLPGAGAAPSGISSLWLMNSADQPLTVTVRPLGEISFPPDKVNVLAGSIRQVVVGQDGASGYLLEALSPFSAAWSIQADEQLAFSTAIPLPSE